MLPDRISIGKDFATGNGLKPRLLRFAVVGALTSGLYVMIVAGLIDLAGFSPGAAAALTYLSLLPVNFIGHKRATFRSRRSARSEAARFLGMHGVTAGASVLVMQVVVQELGLSHWSGSAVVLVLAPLLNFLLMQTWVFHASSPQRGWFSRKWTS